MARRISDVPDDAEWPELEEQFIPDEDPLPDAGGPWTKAYAYLHGARATLDADLAAPTRLLAATAARYILLVTEQEGAEIEPGEEETFERYAKGEIPWETDPLVETLTQLSAFVEKKVQAEQASDES